MCLGQSKYHVLKCFKNHVCELLKVFDSENEARKYRAEKEKEITNKNVFVCVYKVGE